MSSTEPAGRLVGRDAVLAVTGAALAHASDAAGGLLLVAGEPGIGKSAVLAEQARRASDADVGVLRGIGWQGAGAPPYWLWTQVLSGLETAYVGTASGLLDQMAGREGAAAAEARFRIFEAVCGALTDAAPLLVVLDDLQWADPESLRLLQRLHRGLAAERVLLLGAFRDDDAGPQLRALVGSASVVPLTGLDVNGVSALMALVADVWPDPELAAAVQRRCGGNPLFVRELTQLMVARGDWSPGALRTPDAVPAGVRDTLRMRLARLSRPCVDLLELAAIASDVAPVVLAEAAADDSLSIAELLEEAGRARVLIAESYGWRFAHDLYRETLLAGVTPARRAELHAAVGRALVALSAGGTDPAAVGGAARLAAHFVAAGPPTAADALHWSVQAAREATSRLSHEDAARHYSTALDLLREGDGPVGRTELLLDLAAALERSGDPSGARETYLRAAALARQAPDPTALAGAALGIAALGARSGTEDPVGVGLLQESAGLTATGGHDAPRSRVLAALARALRHGALASPDPVAVATADEAVSLAKAAGDASAIAHALLARHDVVWVPGAAQLRLPVLAEMAAAAGHAGDRDLVAEALVLRAAALIEQGDPAGPAELARYIRLVDQLGHPRGRWAALSRRATLAALTGQIEESLSSSAAALELGRAIGLPDAAGVFGTLRGSLATIGGPVIDLGELIPAADPMWPIRPLLRAWGQVNAGDLDGAAASMRGFSVRRVPDKNDLELVAVTATVFAAVGSAAQREWTYRRFGPYAGLHALVGGCAAYHGVVDHYLGILAAALGRATDAIEHLAAAVALYERLGAAAWAQRSQAELDRVRSTGGHDAFRLVGGAWQLAFDGREVHLPDAKGLRDIATLLAAPNRPVHVFTLLGRDAPATGADPVLDRRAVAEFRARVAQLDAEVDEAESWNDPDRAARARVERDAVMSELRAATGLGGRARRLGDETERARKTVTARVHDAMRRIELVEPGLARHLHACVHTGTTCTYTPEAPRHWLL